mgnify:CR=1 FL=1
MDFFVKNFTEILVDSPNFGQIEILAELEIFPN